MEELIGSLLLICLALWALSGVIAFTFKTIAFITANFLAGCDKVFSLGGNYPPFLCWAMVGLVLGSILYFVCREAPALRRPGLQVFLFLTGFAFLFLGPLMTKSTHGIRLPTLSLSGASQPEPQSSRPQPIQPQQGKISHSP